MKELVAKWLGALLRGYIQAAAGFLVAFATLTPAAASVWIDTTVAVVVAVLAHVLSLVWSWVEKRSRVLVVRRFGE